MLFGDTMSNVTFSVGSVAIIDKANVEFKFFDFLFDGVSGMAKELKEQNFSLGKWRS